MKRSITILLFIIIFSLIGCNTKDTTLSDTNGNISNSNENSENQTSTNSTNTNNEKTNSDINKLNPFNVSEESLSSKNINLNGWSCKSQMINLNACRLLLSSIYNKSENNFTFIGYVYEKKTNIPDAIFLDNSVEITNALIYSVGMAANKEGQEKPIPNPSMAKYKYIQTGDNEAIITDLNGKTLGEVEDEDAKTINQRIVECKNILSTR